MGTIVGGPVDGRRLPDRGIAYAIFLPRVRGTIIGSCIEQNFPLL